MLLLCLLVTLKDQVNDGGMWEFRSAAKTAVLDVELLGNRSDLSIHNAVIEFRTRTCENFRMRDCIRQMIRRADKLGPFVPVGVRDRKENPAKARPSHLIFRREIRSPKKGLSIRQQKSCQRPTTLAGNSAYGGLITRIDVRTLVTVHFHGDEVFIDDFGDFGVFVTLAVDDVAPMAPHRSDIKEDGLVFGFRARKRRIAPFVPVNRLVRRGAQVGTGGVLQAVTRRRSHKNPFSIPVDGDKCNLRESAWGFERRTLAAAVYCTMSPGPVSRGSIGLRPAKPSSCRW